MQYRGSGGGMSARHPKVRDPRHLLDSAPRAPDAAPPATPRDSPVPAAPASVAAVVMANSVEGAAPQPSRQPAASEVEVAAGKEERRPIEPVPKKRRLLQAQDEREDILAKVISEVGIDDDSNLVEGYVEDLPISGQGEGVVGLSYTKEVRPPHPSLPLPPRLRVTDPRMRPAFPYQTLEGPYVVRGLRPPYPHYAARPHDLITQQGPPPQYRPVNAYPPRHYPRVPQPPPQTLARLPMVRPSDRRLSPRHGSPPVPRHFRPPPLHTSPTGPPPMHQTHEVHHVFAAPSHPAALPGSSPESPTHLYPSGPLGRPELKDSHLREVYVPVLPLPGGPYANLHPRIPEGFTRLPFDPRAALGRERTPHQVVVAPHLPPRSVYPPERLPGTEPPWRSQPAGDDAWRPARRVIEPPAPCVELIPIGPLRSSTATTPSPEDGRVSDPDNKPSGTHPPPESRPQAGVECRRQSAPAQSDQPQRPPITQRSLSSDPPFGDAVNAVPLVEARQVDGRVVTNIITGDRVYNGRNAPSKRIKRTSMSCEEEARPSSSNSDVTVEKEVYIDRDGGTVTPQSGLPTLCDDAGPALSQSTRTCRPASEPPSGTMAPPVTGRRPASVPAAGTTSVLCPRSEVLEDAAFTERLQLVLNDLVSVPGATQLQELSRSPARLLSTVLRRWGVQPSSHPDLQKRLREDFKTMVKLCMPPTLLQDFGWESCSSEEILTQLIQLSHNGNLERPSSITSSIPLDEALEDDVFSPSTPHPLHPAPLPLQPPPAASQHSHNTPPASQPTQPSPAASQPSQSPSPASQPSQPPPPASQPSQPPSPAFQPSQSPSPASQPPQPPPPASQPSQPPPPASQPSQPPPPASHPSQPPSPASQPPQPPPAASQPSQPPSPASQPPQPPPAASQPSQPPSPAPQPSQPPSPASQPPQPPPPASQPSQPPPPASQPPQPPPPASQPSQPPPPASQPSQPPPPASQPFQPPPPTSQPSQSPSPASQLFQPPPPASQPSQSPSPASQLFQSPPPASQPSQSPSPASQLFQPPSPASQPSQPPSPASQPFQPPSPASQLFQPPSPASQPSQPPSPASQPSQPPPLTSHPFSTTSLVSQPSQPHATPLHSQSAVFQSSETPPQSTLLTLQLSRVQPPRAHQPPPAASQFSQPPSQNSQPCPLRSPSSHPSQPLPPPSQPSHSQPSIFQPSQSPSAAPQPPSITSQSSQPQPSQPQYSVSQPYQPPPADPQPPHSSPPASQSIQPFHQASVPSLSSPPASKHLPSPTLPSRPSHLSLSSPQPSHPPTHPHTPQSPHLQSPTSRPTHLPRHIFQTSQHPAHFTQPTTHHQTHTSQTSHIHSPTSQPSHFPFYVSRHPYPPQHTSQPLPLTSRPTHPLVPSPQPLPHSSQPSSLPPQIPQVTYHQSHASRAPPLSLTSTQPLPHSPHPSQTSPHSPHTIPHFPTKADKLSYPRFQYHTQAYQRPPLPYRFPTRPSQPPPHHGVRNATMTSPGSVENFHQHFRQQQHQHHQQQHQQQHQHQPVRFPSGKCIGSDDVTRPKVHTTTNGQASPPSKGLPT
ncbi:proline-rich protein 36-like isoform X2 [Scylla paramamosain]|uniref:proline-rich protein 36-like isoform X2 n=1 Tax=Scylla paramamosain TaxID=85552 RepID=UPI003082B786